MSELDDTITGGESAVEAAIKGATKDAVVIVRAWVDVETGGDVVEERLDGNLFTKCSRIKTIVKCVCWRILYEW